MLQKSTRTLARCGCTLFAALLLAAPSVEAQGNPAWGANVREGMRVRVLATTLSSPRVGRVLSPDSTGFRLAGPRPGDVTWVEFSTVQVLEVSDGRERGRVVSSGIVLGILAGFGTGFYVGMDMHAPIILGLAGGVLGPIVGAATARERWRRIM
jgi:hypothetical protein